MPAARAPRLPYAWLLAIRFLQEGRAQTLLILLGITLGVAVIVFLTALIDGLQQNIISRTLGTQAHVTLTAPEDRVRQAPAAATAARALSYVQPRAQRLRSIPRWQQVTAGVAGLAGVRDVAAITSGPADALRGDARRQVALMGIELREYVRIVPLPQYLVSGELRLGVGEALVGLELARDLGLGTGDRLRLQGRDGRAESVRVAGIFSAGVRELDQRWVFVPRRSAQTLLALEGGVTHIPLTVTDIFAASDVAAEIGARHDVEAESWMQANRQLMTGLRSQSASSSIIRFFVLVSVAFGIASVLAVSVAQKQREIGILRAMGTSRALVLRVFLIQGGLLGIAGSLLGALAGAGLAMLFQGFAVNADGSPVFPIVITPSLFATAVLTATVTGLVAAALPARQAARLDPVEAIRNG